VNRSGKTNGLLVIRMSLIEELGKILVRHGYITEDNLFQVYDELKIISI
jgi:hypothetical protein